MVLLQPARPKVLLLFSLVVGRHRTCCVPKDPTGFECTLLRGRKKETYAFPYFPPLCWFEIQNIPLMGGGGVLYTPLPHKTPLLVAQPAEITTIVQIK